MGYGISGLRKSEGIDGMVNNTPGTHYGGLDSRALSPESGDLMHLW